MANPKDLERVSRLRTLDAPSQHWGRHDEDDTHREIGTLDKHATATVKDPVCGMTVDPHTAKHRATYQGNPFYFCFSG